MGRRPAEGGRTPKSLSDGIEAYLIDQHNLEIDRDNRANRRRGPRYGKNLGCPLPLAFDILAERWGQDPISWPYEHDAVAVLRFLNRRVAESKARELTASSQGEPVIEYKG